MIVYYSKSEYLNCKSFYTENLNKRARIVIINYMVYIVYIQVSMQKNFTVCKNCIVSYYNI